MVLEALAAAGPAINATGTGDVRLLTFYVVIALGSPSFVRSSKRSSSPSRKHGWPWRKTMEARPENCGRPSRKTTLLAH